MGGNTESSACEFNTLGYGTIGFSSIFGDVSCANASDTIKVSFSKPVFGRTIDLRGKYPQTLIVSESGRSPVNVDLNPSYSYIFAFKTLTR